MCGIIAILSNRNIYAYIIQGLTQLQNRGYDSTGLSYIDNHGNNSKTIQTYKYASTKEAFALDLLIHNTPHINENPTVHMIMAHTRWATHGKKTIINSHPHSSFDRKFSIIHNGVIENYLEIKTFLDTHNIQPISETDSELIVHLIAYYYTINNDITKAITAATQQLIGSWALVIMCIDTPDILYGTKQNTPLLLGCNGKNTICMFASELSAFNEDIEQYIIPNDNEIISIYKEQGNVLYHCNSKTTYVYDNQNKTNVTPYPYTYWLEKEINDQYNCIKNIQNNLYNKYYQYLNNLNNKYQTLYLDNIILLGCGTSYYACMLGEIYLKNIKYFSMVRAYDASIFTEFDIPTKGRTGIILLSQSGETRDLLRCLSFIKRPNILTISILNVIESCLARRTDITLCINAGREVSVPSTKSFTGQLFVLRILAEWFVNNNIEDNSYKHLCSNIKTILDDCKQTIQPYIIPLIKPSMFILGKGKFYPLAKEAALKIKEISYIHAEGYPASALKHGPYSLLEPGFPVILFIMDDIHRELMMNCYEQILARDGFILVITDITELPVKHKICIPKTTYNEILAIIIIQYISFYIGKYLKLPVDTPRNLAKCVTTD
tara:strand:+ start:1506 stop:3326 length:1821 start_codon:yes stop_codon:yes gene_type:complete